MLSITEQQGLWGSCFGDVSQLGRSILIDNRSTETMGFLVLFWGRWASTIEQQRPRSSWSCFGGVEPAQLSSRGRGLLGFVLRPLVAQPPKGLSQQRAPVFHKSKLTPRGQEDLGDELKQSTSLPEQGSLARVRSPGA